MYDEGESVGPTPSVKTEHKTLEGVISKIVSISDVSGAAIIRADGSVVSWRAKDGDESKQDIDSLLHSMSAAYKKKIHHYKDGMFTESIIDHNGHKILMSRIREDMMLMLVLDKRAYLGLTMLDMEGCIREIDKALDEHNLMACKVPG